VNVKVEELGENNVHNNAFYAEERRLKSELEAMCDCNPLTARHWIVRHAYPGFRAVQIYYFLLLCDATTARSFCLNSFNCMSFIWQWYIFYLFQCKIQFKIYFIYFLSL
jgi:hypothetical protein